MNPELLFVKEFKSPKDKLPSYPPRTYYNAKSSDVTLALAVDLNTKGEQLTHRAAGDKYIGFQLLKDTLTIDIARSLYRKLKESNAKTLNIAGNGIYTLIKHDCDQAFINQFTYEIISQVNHFYPLERIYTGGQTGVDIAGAVAGYALGIPTEVTLPEGYLQRFGDNKDVKGSKEIVEKQIIEGALALEPYQLVIKKHTKPNI